MSQDKLFHYSACGLDVRIHNFPMKDDCGKDILMIPDLAGMHRTIAQILVYMCDFPITGHALKFLRTELGKKPASMAVQLGCPQDELVAWESSDDPIPLEVDLNVRLLVMKALRLKTRSRIHSSRHKGKVSVELSRNEQGCCWQPALCH